MLPELTVLLEVQQRVNQFSDFFIRYTFAFKGKKLFLSITNEIFAPDRVLPNVGAGAMRRHV
jgi:hypothetical protein